MKFVCALLLIALAGVALAEDGGRLALDGSAESGVLVPDQDSIMRSSFPETYWFDIPLSAANTPNATVKLEIVASIEEEANLCYAISVGSESNYDCLGDSQGGKLTAYTEVALIPGDEGRGIATVWCYANCTGRVSYTVAASIGSLNNGTPLKKVKPVEKFFRPQAGCNRECCVKRNKLGRCTNRSTCSIECPNPFQAPHCYCEPQPRCTCQ